MKYQSNLEVIQASPSVEKILRKHIIQPDGSGVIWWHICNFSESLDKHKTILAIHRAFAIWSPHFYPVIFLPTDQFDRAQIRIYFVPPDHSEFVVHLEGDKQKVHVLKCPFHLDGEGGVLAHAFPPYLEQLRGDIHLDQSEKWTLVNKAESKKQGFDLLTVLCHEIGHCLGFGHVQASGAMMYHEFEGPKSRLAKADIDLIESMYSDAKRRVGGAAAVAANKPFVRLRLEIALLIIIAIISIATLVLVTQYSFK